MNQKIRTKKVDWKEMYHETESPLWKPEPHLYTIEAVKMSKGGSALDIGSGEGYDAFYLAKHGYKTTAVDIAPKEQERLANEARSHNLSIVTQESDVSRHISLTDMYDIIVSYGFLHFAGKNTYSEYIKTLKNHTYKGGIHSFYTFGDVGNFHDIGKHKFWFPSADSLKTLYFDWKIIKLEEKTIQTLVRGDNGEPLYNSLIKLLAIK